MNTTTLSQKIAFQDQSVHEPDLNIVTYDGAPKYHRGELYLPESLTANEASFYIRSAIHHIHSLKGNLSLHAAYIQNDNIDVLLIGPPKSGKSTIVHNAASQGYEVIADDHVILNDKYAFGNRTLRHRQDDQTYPTKQITRRHADHKLIYLGSNEANQLFQNALKYRLTPLRFRGETIDQDRFYQQTSQSSKLGLDRLIRQSEECHALTIDEAKEAIQSWM